MTDVYKESDAVYRTLIDNELMHIDSLTDIEKFYLMLELGVNDLSTWTITDKVYDFIRANDKLYAASYMDISYPRLRAFNEDDDWDVSAKPSKPEVLYPRAIHSYQQFKMKTQSVPKILEVAIPVVRIPFCVKTNKDTTIFGWEGYYDCD